MTEIMIKEGWQLNPDKKIVDAILRRLEVTGGECPCHNPGKTKDERTCPCKEYRENNTCHCSLYVRRKFKCASHLTMADRHITEYEAHNAPFDFMWLYCTPVELYFDEPTRKKRKAFNRFNLKGTIYKFVKELKEALRDRNMRPIKRFLVRGVKATDTTTHEDLFFLLSSALSYADSVFQQGYDVTVIDTKNERIIKENRHYD